MARWAVTRAGKRVDQHLDARSDAEVEKSDCPAPLRTGSDLHRGEHPVPEDETAQHEEQSIFHAGK